MKRLLLPCACALALCSTALSSEPAAGEEPVFAQLQKLTDELVAKDGFSDEDAVTAAVFLTERMIGDPRPWEKLSAHIIPTKPGYVKVFAAYDHVKFRGYEFEFFCGENRTICVFVSMTHVPSQ